MGLGAPGAAAATQSGLGRWEGLKQGLAQSISRSCRRPHAQHRAGREPALGKLTLKNGGGGGAAHEPVNKQAWNQDPFE